MGGRGGGGSSEFPEKLDLPLRDCTKAGISFIFLMLILCRHCTLIVCDVKFTAKSVSLRKCLYVVMPKSSYAYM